MDSLGSKTGPQKDYKELLKEEDTKTINALPDFEIRTMKADLAGLGVKKLDKSLFMQDKTTLKTSTPGITPVAPKKPHTNEQTPEAEPQETKTEAVQKPEGGMIVPENLPIMPMTKKSALPSIEELVKKEEESPMAPLPPQKTDTFFVVPETPPPAPVAPRQAPQITNAETFPQMDRVKIPEPIYAPERENIRRILKFATIGIIVIAVIGGGAFIYFKNKNSSESVPIVTPKPEPKLSSSLINTEEIKIISLENGQNVFQLLRAEAKADQPVLTYKRVGVLKNESEFLNITDFFQSIEIPIPPYALSELEDNYNLLIFNQQEGKRIGLVAKTSNPENLKNQLMIWEPTMLEDFKNFYPIQVPGQAASKDFLNDNYKNVIIRYKNLPYPSLTLNYTVLGNYLVIGTSKELIYSTIDRILGQQ